MPYVILLYGATGYSGRLIATEMALVSKARPGVYRMVLAGRNAECLKALAAQHAMDYCVFALEDSRAMANALRDADVVINAAGPFAQTAPMLVGVALEVKCNYVDINGEADVYTRLRDNNITAWHRRLAIVCSAGFWAAASDLLLDNALAKMAALPASVSELGAIRIAMSRIQTFSRGSAATVWRSLRQQVKVVRKGRTGPPGSMAEMVIWHEPVGKLERTFDFCISADKKPVRRIASAASLVDTLVALETTIRHKTMAGTIESYVEAGLSARVGYQAGALFSPLAALPAIGTLALQPLGILAEGPTEEERRKERHIVLLHIEDRFRSTILDWRWDTPNVYQFTAQLVVAVAAQVATRKFKGCLTPAQVLAPLRLPLTAVRGPTRACELHDRS